MFRQSITKPLLAANRLVATRSFSAAAIRMGEGDTGAPRSAGMKSGDVWTKKESAQENLFVRQKEMEKLKVLKEKLQKQRQHLDELDAHIDALTKDQGGEQH
ncbi:hypothetical protein AJ80_08275 [Polytolypa hystricis UAMH7299]|uniref:ATPase inhibitor, mitochondrial n=1 Tax=Polytolypa hystricis (strain UAMH7299) TaxID=1447883 RepID=A0A2B7XAV3_POLH7|nr:hypothetical protein AJ80_08275 [Polytolypa hystricis UAMH7299]